MSDLRIDAPAQRASRDAVGLSQAVRSQHGVVSRDQLHSRGLSGSAISRWVATGRLHRVHPGVYAVGHAALSTDARLTAALLYAGSQAVLSHTTAAWAWSILEAEPKRIHITLSSRRRSLAGVRVHHTRRLERDRCRDLPVTPVARTLLDLATTLSRSRLRRALAEADYRGLLDQGELVRALGRGRPGSSALRQALRSHMPRLAQTRSALEERFLALCEKSGIPLPEVNAKIGRMTVDALWREPRVVVELDGSAAHGGWPAIKRDRQRELALRSQGLQVLRYTWEQVTRHGGEVAADLRRALGASR